jgi:hypothetical protein
VPPQNIPVTVHVDFKDIAYNTSSSTWSIPAGKPKWTVPAKTPVQSGANLITWTLRSTNVPSGFSATFDTSDGIVFDAGWPGGAPSMQTTTTITATDDFEPGGATEDYEYSVNVVLTMDANSSVSHDFPYDPDVENEGSTPIISHK